MPYYTIDDFWKKRLPVANVPSANLPNGWSFISTGHETFKEAPLTRSKEFGNEADPRTRRILLVSAAGAVGKSTLARQIAYTTGAVYIDLGEAEPVGGNTLSGGLVKSDLYDAWKNGRVAVLVDGLDEARLRVTQESFEAFLSDIKDLSRRHKQGSPIVLFGRTGACQDTWMIFQDNNIDVPVLEIGYYDPNDSVAFAEAHLQMLRARQGKRYTSADLNALQVVLNALRQQTESDGDRFAGYAPVLLAVAERVAKENNPAALVSKLKEGGKVVTLGNIVSDILLREQSKLIGLNFSDTRLYKILYSPNEQLQRIVSRVYGLPPPDFPPMQPSDAQIYSQALETWVAEHPFLDGHVGASTIVFEGAIAARALRSRQSEDAALRRELGRGAAANPFLAEFYLSEANGSEGAELPAEHIGVLYASLRAQLAIGDIAHLSVEGLEDADDEENRLYANVEISLLRSNRQSPRTLQFVTIQVGTIYLGGHVEDVDLAVPHAKVEIGPGAEAVLIAPINIQCKKLTLTTERVIVEASSAGESAAVYLEAREFDGVRMASVPVLRGDVSLSASWPGVNVHPWTNFASAPTPPADPKIDEALRRLRKFVIAFRSHGKGTLARYKYKLEHERMTKGVGQAVLDLLVESDILKLEGSMYFLDPDKLAEKAATNYRDCMARRFGSRTIAFVQRAL